jgi:hypothetical protein
MVENEMDGITGSGGSTGWGLGKVKLNAVSAAVRQKLALP